MLERTPTISAWKALHNNPETLERKGGERDRERERGKGGVIWVEARMVWAKKLPASQPLHVWPGTALSRLFWGLSKAHHGKEAVSVGMLQGARARQGGETRDLARQLGDNEEENSYSCPQ